MKDKMYEAELTITVKDRECSAGIARVDNEIAPLVKSFAPTTGSIGWPEGGVQLTFPYFYFTARRSRENSDILIITIRFSVTGTAAEEVRKALSSALFPPLMRWAEENPGGEDRAECSDGTLLGYQLKVERR